MRARLLALSLPLLALPTAARAQSWPVQGTVTVQTQAPPPPPPAPAQVEVQMQAPPPPPVVVEQPPVLPPPPTAPPPPMVIQQPTLGYNLVYGPDPETVGARVQLVVGQGLNGMALGLCVAGLAGAERSAIYSGALLLGGGLGAVGALLATRDGVTTGQAAVINNSTLFGGAVAGYALLGLNESRINERTTWGVLGAGLLLGTGAGIAVATQRPLSGRVEFASSLGGWSAFFGGHLYFATQGYNRADSGLAIFAWSSLGLMAAGVAAGALIAPNVPVSAARMRWINLSGLGGWAVIGLSSLLLASDGDGRDAMMAYGIGSIAGAAGGAVLGYFLTANVDAQWARGREEARNQVSFSPGGPGGSPGLSLSGTF